MTIDSYKNVAVNDEKELQIAVATQPVSVAIEGGGRDFQFYDSVCKMLYFNLHVQQFL